MYRVNRDDGDVAWRDARGGERFVRGTKSFVAANDRYVYTIDAAGQLVVIDRARGTALQALDTRDYTYAMANDQTDRLYLASNSGSLICLHDRAISAPKHHPKGAATSVGGDSAADLFKPASSIKPKRPGEPPQKPKEAKPKEEAPKADMPKEEKK